MLVWILSALGMSLTMYLIARHEADTSIWRTLIIAITVSILTMAASFILGILALLVGFGLAAWAVHHFCYLRWPQALVTATVFVAIQFGTPLLLGQ